MKNIKLSFEHPNYSHPFKLNLVSNSDSISMLQRINYRQLNEQYSKIMELIILSNEEHDIFNSLPLGFKYQFMVSYEKEIGQRMALDYLGKDYNQHFQKFSTRVVWKLDSQLQIKHFLEIKNYIEKLLKIYSKDQQQTVSAEINFLFLKDYIFHKKWMALIIRFFNLFLKQKKQKQQEEELQNQDQHQIFIVIFSTLQIIEKIIVFKYAEEYVKIVHDLVLTSLKAGKIFNLKMNFREQIMLIILNLCRVVIEKIRNSKQNIKSDIKKQGQNYIIDGKNQKTVSKSQISWITHPFSPTTQKTQKNNFFNRQTLDLIDNAFKQFSPQSTILHEILSFLSTKIANICVLEESFDLIRTIFLQIQQKQQKQSFTELLFLITETIRHELPKILNQVEVRIRQREFKNQQGIRNYLSYDFYQFLGKQKVQLFKLKEIIKIQKRNEKNINFNGLQKKLYKSVKMLIQKFNNYKNGKIVYQKKRKGSLINEIARKKQKEIQPILPNYEEQQIQIQALQKSIRQSNTIKANQINQKQQMYLQLKQIELYKQNQQLLKINQFYQDNIKQKQQIISDLINLNQQFKQKGKNKLRIIQKTVLITCACNVPINAERSSFNSSIEKVILNDGNSHIPYSSQFTKQISLEKDIGVSLTQNILKQKNKEPVLPSSFHAADNSEIPSEISYTILPPPPPPPPPPNSDKNIQQNAKVLPQAPPYFEPPPLPSILGLISMPPPLPTFISILEKSCRKQTAKLEQKYRQHPQLKSIGWNTIDTSKIKNTFWEKAHQNNSYNKDDLIKVFRRNQPKNNSYKNSLKMKLQQKSILKPDRARNTEIVLKKMKIGVDQFKFIRQSVLSFNEDFLTEYCIGFLLNIIATQKQKDQFLQITSSEWLDQQWTLSDRFLNFVSKILLYQIRLKAILFKYQFIRQVQQFHRKINQFIDFFQEIKNDQFFHYFLLIFLEIGNFLNSKSIEGNAKGFRMLSIQKSYTLIGQDQKTSLFEFVLRTMHENKKQIFDSKSLKKTNSVVGLSILSEDLRFFQEKNQLVEQCIMVGEQSEDEYSTKYFLRFYIQTTEQLTLMKNRLMQAKLAFKEANDYYGDKLQCQDFNKFIIVFRKRINQFISKKQFFWQS